MTSRDEQIRQLLQVWDAASLTVDEQTAPSATGIKLFQKLIHFLDTQNERKATEAAALTHETRVKTALINKGRAEDAAQHAQPYEGCVMSLPLRYAVIRELAELCAIDEIVHLIVEAGADDKTSFFGVAFTHLENRVDCEEELRALVSRGMCHDISYQFTSYLRLFRKTRNPEDLLSARKILPSVITVQAHEQQRLCAVEHSLLLWRTTGDACDLQVAVEHVNTCVNLERAEAFYLLAVYSHEPAHYLEALNTLAGRNNSEAISLVHKILSEIANDRRQALRPNPILTRLAVTSPGMSKASFDQLMEQLQALEPRWAKEVMQMLSARQPRRS